MCRTALTPSAFRILFITKEQVENTLKELEEVREKKTSESDVKEEHEATEEAESADI